MPNLSRGLFDHKAIGAELLRRFREELQDDPETLEDTLEGLSPLPEMIAAVLRSADDDELMIPGIGERIGKLRLRQKRIQERAQRKRDLATHYCQEAGIKRIAAPDFTATVSMGKGHVIITNEKALADEWFRIKKNPNLEKIGKALHSGEIVDGAELSNPKPQITIRRS